MAMDPAVEAAEAKMSEEVKAIVAKGNADMRAAIKTKMKEVFPEHTEEKLEIYVTYVMEWDNVFDDKRIDPGRVINAWIEVIVLAKAIKKELKNEKDEEKKQEQLTKKLKAAFKDEFTKEFSEEKGGTKLEKNDIKDIYHQVYEWHTEKLLKDVNKFVKAWVEVEAVLTPIREEVEKTRDAQEEKEHAAKLKEEAAEAKRKAEEDRLKWESEKEQRAAERARKKQEAEEKKMKEEEEKRLADIDARKPRFYKAQGKAPAKVVSKKDAATLTDYLKKNKGTAFVCMFCAKSTKVFLSEHVKEYQAKYPDFHWISCKMDDDLTKAAKVWFNAWDMYTINQYPCIAVFNDGKLTKVPHIFFVNFEEGVKQMEEIFTDAKILPYGSKK